MVAWPLLDVLGTYLATPTLKLESNIVAKKTGWPVATLTTPVSSIAYHDTAIAFALIAAPLPVSWINSQKARIVRTLGEPEYRNRLGVGGFAVMIIGRPPIFSFKLFKEAAALP